MTTVEALRDETKPETTLEEAEMQKTDDTGLVYDPHGMFLIPQPTDRSDDPLVSQSPKQF